MLSLPLFDAARGRSLATTARVPSRADGPLPLTVFGHGFNGHPRKFTKLLDAWADAGYVVAAPAFPHTNDEGAAATRRPESSFGRGSASAGSPWAASPRWQWGSTRATATRGRARSASFPGGSPRSPGGPHEVESKPLLIVHGTDDSIVPFERGEEVYHAAEPPKALVALEGARHHEEIEDGEGPVPVVVETTLAFWGVFLRDDEARREQLLAARLGTRVSSEGL